MDNNYVAKKKGPQYNPSSAQGIEAATKYQYGKGDHGAKAEGNTVEVWDRENPGGGL